MAVPSSRELYGQVAEAALSKLSGDSPSDEVLSTLNFIFGSMLMPALALVDRGDVNKYRLPGGRHFYRVTGAKGKSYTVHPADLREMNAFCPCAAFTYSCVVTEQHLMCKHVLAVRIAEKTGRCQAIEIVREAMAELLYSGRA